MSMSEWQKYKLGEVYSFSSGLSKSSDQFGYGYDFLTFKDVFNNYFLPDKLTALVNSTEKERQTCSIKRGDVFLTRTSETDDELGMSSVALKDYPNATFNGFTKRLRPLGNVEIYPEFVAYYFRSPRFRANIVGMSSITTRASLNNSMLAELPLLLPNYEEQVRIATILKSLDDKIGLLHRENTTLEAMAETLFRQWFIEEAKEDWEEGKLDDILSVKGGTTPSTKESRFWNGNIAWTSPRDVTTLKGIYLFKTEKTITEDGLREISSGLLPKGTLLMSSRAPVGVLAIAEIPVAVNQGYIAILDNKGYAKEFIYLWLKLNMDLVHSYSNGSTFMEISKSTFKSLELQIPSIKEVERFVNGIKPIFEKIRNNEKHIQTLIQTRDSLIPKLMSNEIVI